MPKLINEIGNTYGYLTVIDSVKENNRTKWICRCKCGKEVIALGNTLRSGNTKSCGCMKAERMYNNHKKVQEEMIGKTYGFLQVLDFGEDGKRDRHMKCKCLSCNRIKEVRAADLKSGKIISCGCINSRGNAEIFKFLTERTIPFKDEFRIPECKDKAPLPFDFAIFDNNNQLQFLIEYQGKQHYSCQNVGWDDPEHFEITKKHDKIKKDYCLTNNIKLVIISYKENLQQRLEELFK